MSLSEETGTRKGSRFTGALCVYINGWELQLKADPLYVVNL